MRYALLIVCLLVGCVGPNHSLTEFLTPDEFHVFYSDGGGSGSGSSYGKYEPWRRFSNQESSYTSWTLGLSWSLTSPDPELREAARQMQISARLMAEAARSAPTARAGTENLPITTELIGFQPPEPLQVVVEAPAPVVVPPVIVERSKPAVLTLPPALEVALLSWLSRVASEPCVAPAASPALSEPPADDADEPRGIKLLGISSEVWTQLIIALGILATAVAGYLGREKIPVVKNMTKKGRAAKAES